MYLFLINPEAGGKRFGKLEGRVVALLERVGVKHKFVMIENLADIDNLLETHLKNNIDGVVAVGGNATVNAIINALVSEDTPVAILPMSRTNHLAHSLGIRRWDQAIRALADPEIKQARLGRIGSHYFVGSAEIASHHDTVAKYLKQTNAFLRFLGIKQTTPTENTAVRMQLILDQQLTVVGDIHRVAIGLLEGVGNKKMRVEIDAHDADNKISKTVLLVDELSAESEKKMPVMIGNETIAHTPIEIKGSAKYIKLIVPKSAKLPEVNPA
jgi:diacylglycerol kinase family enzyme